MSEVLLLTLKPNREEGERWGATEFTQRATSEGEGGGRGTSGHDRMRGQ